MSPSDSVSSFDMDEESDMGLWPTLFRRQPLPLGYDEEAVDFLNVARRGNNRLCRLNQDSEIEAIDPLGQPTVEELRDGVLACEQYQARATSLTRADEARCNRFTAFLSPSYRAERAIYRDKNRQLLQILKDTRESMLCLKMELHSDELDEAFSSGHATIPNLYKINAACAIFRMCLYEHISRASEALDDWQDFLHENVVLDMAMISFFDIEIVMVSFITARLMEILLAC